MLGQVHKRRLESSGCRPGGPRAAVLAISAGLLVACGGTTEGGGPVDDPWDRCPSPGPGVTIGGNPGSGDQGPAPQRRVVLMGGGSEDDDAATLFVEAASGGDIVILRASGSLTSYPDYFASGLSASPPPSSAVTVLTGNPGAGGDPAALCWLGNAEAVWLAGGSQWDYLGGWPTALHSGLAEANMRGVAIGGTSAGAVSLGEAAFDARFGTVTSAEALADPLHQDVSLSYPAFSAPELGGVFVDSHFFDRDREGRLLVFLARFLSEKDRSEVVGLGLDERAAIVIQGGTFRVYSIPGQYAWLYRVRGPTELGVGQPLELSGITRFRLAPGDDGPWPPDFSSLQGTELQVRGGVVGVPQ